MSRYLPVELRQQIRQRDRECCCYCLTRESISGISLAFDHIHPQSKGGESTIENLCLSCRVCNEFKSNQTEAKDPLTGQIVPLFNPCTQKWTDHFSWSANDTMVTGETAIGRATVQALKMNNAAMVAARQRWVTVGWHPPSDSDM